MLEQLTEFIESKNLFEKGDRILLAVSGGNDSMVLLNLFEKTGYDYGVVHCNFQLRGYDSLTDEKFVKEQVLNHGVPFFLARFNTKEFAALNGISIEMAARALRYDYFEKVRFENHYDYIATAHHQDDLIETFFLNLVRKTGIRGLTGIREKNGKIIRPLLFANRLQIEQYARQQYIEFREDSSNNEIIFRRNFIRHRIIPAFTELNTAFKENVSDTMSNLREAEEVYEWILNEAKEKVVSTQNDELIIYLEKLMEFPFPKVLLFEILAEYNFNPKVAGQVFIGMDSTPGKQYYSRTHRLVKDRKNLFVTALPENERRIFYIEEEDIELFAPFDLALEKLNIANFRMIKSPSAACIDLNQIEFPLLIRKWEFGDYFQPLGMKGFKKVSDYLIDEKVPLHIKENTWLLCSGQKIVWVIGHRIDNRFKITDATTKVLIIQIKKE